MKSLGATHAFDYRSPTCAEDIKKATSSRLAYALDCIATPPAIAISVAAFGPQGGKYTSLLHVEKLERDDVSNNFTIAYTALGERFVYGPTEFPPSKTDFDFAVKFAKIARDLLEQGKYRVHPPEVREGGLEGILDGLKDLREKNVSGKKLVYRVS